MFRFSSFMLSTFSGWSLSLVISTCALGAPGVVAQVAVDQFVGSAACARCHQGETASWRVSHHAWAWKAPTAESVLGDFEESTFSGVSREAKFSRKGEQFFVKTEGANGKTETYAIQGTVGITPLQQYLIETEPGKLQALDIAWDTLNKRWFSLDGSAEFSHDNGQHWTGPYKNWNGRCAECHATNYQKRYNPRERTYHSNQTEIGVGCEACHGGGLNHLAWADQQQAKNQNLPVELTQNEPLHKGFDATLRADDADSLVNVCGGCHSRREFLGKRVPNGLHAFNDSYRLALLRPNLYHNDGSVKDEVYVLGSFLQSKMYASGVQCGNCHNVHTGNLKIRGNGLCNQCHSQSGNPQFPGAGGVNYDSPNHHFHKVDSAGAQCANCHMPDRTFMTLDERRDHSFSIPRPDLTDLTGAPNSCNACHEDRSASWAAAEITRRMPKIPGKKGNFGELFTAARANPVEYSGRLLTFAHNSDNAAIVRATALDILRGVPSAGIASRSADLLQSDDPLIRMAAATLQRGASTEDRINMLAPLLIDPDKSVRIIAAKELAGRVSPSTNSDILQDYRAANAELLASLMQTADFPETHLTLGGIALQLQNLSAALSAFDEAVRQDPQLVDAWIMVVRLSVELGYAERAKPLLESALQANPNDKRLLAMLSAMP